MIRADTSLHDMIRATIENRAMLPGAPSPLLLMVSGGSDSVALLRMMVDLSSQGLKDVDRTLISVLHVNHLLRGEESDGDERFVVDLCRELGVSCYVERVDVDALVSEERGNMENIARRERYRLAEELVDQLCEDARVDPSSGRILVAHTRDDRVETFYMRSIVGTGPGGLASIQHVRGRVVRPLLEVQREDLREYLASIGQIWREDATNADITHFRSFVRSEIIPRAKRFNPALARTLAHTMDLIADEDAFLDGLVENLRAKAVTVDVDGTVLLDCASLVAAPRPLARRLVYGVVRDIVPPTVRVDSHHIERIVDEGQNVGFVTVLPSVLRVENEYGTLAFYTGGFGKMVSADESLGVRRKTLSPAVLAGSFEDARLGVPGEMDFGPGGIIRAVALFGGMRAEAMSSENRDSVLIDADSLTGELWVTPPREGERLCPLGMKGQSKKISDLLIDEKVPRRLRGSIPVVHDGSGPDARVVWVAGVRLDERFKVTPSTKRTVRLTVGSSVADGKRYSVGVDNVDFGRTTSNMHSDLTKVLFTEQEIADCVKAMGAQITEDYEGEPILLVAVLRGASIFMADLARAIEGPLEMDFMAVSSYGSDTKSSGVVRIIKDLDSQIRGRHVIIAEDILDSGLTLKYLLKNLASRKPASLEVATLLHKEGKQQVPIECRYTGFSCPDEFVVGYGLDYAERYRNLPYIGILDPKIYQK